MSEKYKADDIRALDGRVHVQMRPKMYFEKCYSENSLDSLPFEVLCHAFDEYFDKNCSEVKLTIWKNAFSINYNAGMSLATKHNDMTTAEIIMTKIGACSNLKKHLAVGQEFCSLGMAIINSASKKCKLITHWKNQKGTFEFENGETKTKIIEPFENENSWTEIYVEPNKLLFGDLCFTSTGIMKKAKEINKRLTDLDLIITDKIE